MLSLNPGYRAIDQLRYCCVPASILMILERKGIANNLTQEEIGNRLGLIVPDKHKHLFNNVMHSYERPKAGWGTQIQKEKYSIKNLLHELGLNIEFTIIQEADWLKVKEVVEKNLEENNDMIVCFNYKALYGFGNDGGHVSLIESITNETITFVDPDDKYPPKRKEVQVKNLTSAMNLHKDHSGGIWLFSDSN